MFDSGSQVTERFRDAILRPLVRLGALRFGPGVLSGLLPCPLAARLWEEMSVRGGEPPGAGAAGCLALRAGHQRRDVPR